MTVRQRITFLIVSAVVTALAVGAAGLFALRQTGQQLDDLYKTSLVPIVEVTAIRDLFNDNRTGLKVAKYTGPYADEIPTKGIYEGNATSPHR